MVTRMSDVPQDLRQLCTNEWMRPHREYDAQNECRDFARQLRVRRTKDAPDLRDETHPA
jgi:hypothetical protein